MVIDIATRPKPSHMTRLVLAVEDFDLPPHAVAAALIADHSNAATKLLCNEHRYWLFRMNIAKADFCFKVLEHITRLSLPRSRRRLPRHPF